jgi:WD40 repeat protein
MSIAMRRTAWPALIGRGVAVGAFLLILVTLTAELGCSSGKGSKDIVDERQPPSSPSGPGGSPKVATGEPRSFVHPDRVNAVVFSPNGRQALSACADTMVRLWDLESDKPVQTCKGQTIGVSDVAFAGENRALGCGDVLGISVWELPSGKALKPLTASRSNVWCLAASPDGRRALSGSQDRTVRRWDIEAARELDHIQVPGGSADRIAFLPGDQALVGTPRDNTLRVYDLKTKQVVHQLQVPTWTLGKAAALLPDGRRVLLGCSDAVLRLMDLTDGKELRRFPGHSGYVMCVAVSADGRRGLSGGMDKTMRLWDLETGKEIQSFTGHTDQLTSVAFSPDGRRALSGGGFDKTMRLWQLPE